MLWRLPSTRERPDFFDAFFLGWVIFPVRTSLFALTVSLLVITKSRSRRNRFGGIKADARSFSRHGNYGKVDGRQPGQNRTRGRGLESLRRQGFRRRTQRGFSGGCGRGRRSGVDVRLRHEGGR